MTKVSIVIATCGRLEAVRETIHSLFKVLLPEECSVELVLIENGVRSEVDMWLQELPTKPIETRYIFEPAKGKSNALNIAVDQTSSDILVFTDDDVRFPENWLVEMCTPLLRGEGAVVVGGSRLAPHLLRNWMTRQHRSLLASTEYLLDDCPSEFAGVNMACLREVFRKVPQFDCELGGGGLGNAEDCLFAYQLKQAGYAFVSRTKVHLEHHPTESRLLYRSWIQATASHGRSIAYVLHHFYHEKIPFLWARLWWLRLKLHLRLLVNRRRLPDEEGIPPWELSYRIDIAKYEHYGSERNRQRNYEKRGLQKRLGLVVGVSMPS